MAAGEKKGEEIVCRKADSLGLDQDYERYKKAPRRKGRPSLEAVDCNRKQLFQALPANQETMNQVVVSFPSKTFTQLLPTHLLFVRMKKNSLQPIASLLERPWQLPSTHSSKRRSKDWRMLPIH